jgi:hypothetical protein
MIDDTISKWELTGLAKNTSSVGILNTSHALNNQAEVMKALVSYKYVHPSSPIIQLMLSVVSEVGKELFNDPRVYIVPADNHPFFDNPDIRIKLRHDDLDDIRIANHEMQELDKEFEQEHFEDITSWLIDHYREKLADDSLETLFIHQVLGVRLDSGVPIGYTTSYATYRKW